MPLSSNQDLIYQDSTGHSWITSGPTRPVHILSKEVGPCSNRHVPLWQIPSDVTYCQQPPSVQAGGGCSDCIQLMTLLPNGWRHTVRKCTRQQQQSIHCNTRLHICCICIMHVILKAPHLRFSESTTGICCTADWLTGCLCGANLVRTLVIWQSGWTGYKLMARHRTRRRPYQRTANNNRRDFTRIGYRHVGCHHTVRDKARTGRQGCWWGCHGNPWRWCA